MYKIIFHTLYYIGFILMFFDAFVFWVVPNTSAFYPIVLLPIGALYILLLFNKPKRLLKFYLTIFKIPTVKIYFIFLGAALISSLVHLFLGYYTAPLNYYINRFLKFIVYGIILQFFPVLSIYLHINIRKIISTFYMTIFVILIFGILQFLSYKLNISIFNQILSIFFNVRSELLNDETVTQTMRVNAIYSEPSAFAKFLFITMPIIYLLSITKFKIFANNFINIFIKKSFIPFFIINILLTQSPIYLVFCTIELIILYIAFNINSIKKHMLGYGLIIVLIVYIGAILYTFNSEFINNSYLSRIINSFHSINNFNQLVSSEPSLATRLTSYYMALKVFSQNIFFGCGLFNFQIYINHIFLKIELPVTKELISAYYRLPYGVTTDANLIYCFLAETGIVGTGLFVLYILKLKNLLNKCMNNMYNIESIFAKGISISLILIIIIGCYNVGFNYTILHLIFGIALLLSIKNIGGFDDKKNIFYNQKYH